MQKQVFEGFDQGLMPGSCSWFYADINETKRQQKDGVGGLRKWQFLMMVSYVVFERSLINLEKNSTYPRKNRHAKKFWLLVDHHS